MRKILIRASISFSHIGVKKIQLNYLGDHFALAYNGISWVSSAKLGPADAGDW